MLALVLAAAVAISSAPPPSPVAGATNDTAPVTSPAPGSKDDPNKVICRNEEVTGSRFLRRVCLTRAAWDKQSADAQRMERQLNEQAATNGGSAPP